MAKSLAGVGRRRGPAVILAVARRARKSALADSAVRQEQGENLTEAVIDYVEGMGIIKAYNLLGTKSGELTGNFCLLYTSDAADD